MEEKIIVDFRTCKSGQLHPDNFHCYYETIASFTNWEEDKLPSLGDEFICRFCGEKNRKQFSNKNAHAFPEFTGNKTLFSKYECKACNSKFQRYEDELAKHGLLMRTIYGMPTKKNPFPTFKNNTFRLHRDKDGFKMNIFSDKISREKENAVVLNFDFDNNKQKAKITIPENDYIPLYLFKALSKIALTIMPEKELENENFCKYKEWLNEIDASFSDERFQPYFYVYHNRFQFSNRKPLLMLFKKIEKYKDENIPSYSFLFFYGNHMFQVFLPYCKTDEFLIEKSYLKLLIIPELLIEGKFIWMNGFTKDRQRFKPFEFTVNES